MEKQSLSKEFKRTCHLLNVLYFSICRGQEEWKLLIRYLMHHLSALLGIFSPVPAHSLPQLFQLLPVYQKKAKFITLNGSLVCPDAAGVEMQQSVQKSFVFKESWGSAVGGVTIGHLNRAE